MGEAKLPYKPKELLAFALIRIRFKRCCNLDSAVVLIRMLLEDLITHPYSVRLDKASGNFLYSDTTQKIISLEIKLFIFIEIAKPFVENYIKLLLGTTILAIPSIIEIFFDGRLPRIPVLRRLLSGGAFKIVATVFIGTLAAGFIRGLFAAARTFLVWQTVALAIPGLILFLLGKMTKKPSSDWKITPLGNTAYQLLGVLVFLAIIQFFAK